MPAILVYFFFYLVQIFTLIADVKYLIVGIERRIAFKDRADYEGRDTVGTKKMLIVLVSSSKPSLASAGILI